MNNDRFLTRVFDKQEKRMLYLGDEFEFIGDSYIFLAINNGCIFVEQNKQVTYLKLRDHQDRFVPMMCQRWIDKNSKLIWEADIINDDIGTGIITLDKKSNYLKIVYPKQNLGKWFIDFLESEKKNIEVIGNIHENEKLLEVKE